MSDAGFEFAIETARLQQTLDNMLAVVDECIWTFYEDELFIGGVDPANVALTHQTATRDAFEYYNAAELEIGLNLQRLDDYLGEIQSEIVELSWDAEKRQLQIHSENADINMAAIDPDSVRQQGEVSDIRDELPVVMVLEAGAVEHAINLADMVSDHMDLDTDPARDNPFHIVAVGDVDDVDIDFGGAVITSDYGAEAVSKYSIGYWENIFKPIPKDAEVMLRHGDEFPSILEWEFAEGHIDVETMIAPRV